ncbi:MAG TPA: hypothetical protein VMB51_15800 [Solirubrobacteraceae bacterium]|nr:hypothetical protein [Solirubrobacteraceae bacterium]
MARRRGYGNRARKPVGSEVRGSALMALAGLASSGVLRVRGRATVGLEAGEWAR